MISSSISIRTLQTCWVITRFTICNFLVGKSLWGVDCIVSISKKMYIKSGSLPRVGGAVTTAVCGCSGKTVTSDPFAMSITGAVFAAGCMIVFKNSGTGLVCMKQRCPELTVFLQILQYRSPQICG